MILWGFKFFFSKKHKNKYISVINQSQCAPISVSKYSFLYAIDIINIHQRYTLWNDSTECQDFSIENFISAHP